MNDHEIEQFILTYGRDILRFCRMTAGRNRSRRRSVSGYHAEADREKADLAALSAHQKLCFIYSPVSLEKQQKEIRRQKPHSSHGKCGGTGRGRMAIPGAGLRCFSGTGACTSKRAGTGTKCYRRIAGEIQTAIYLFYSADMQISEIAEILRIPEGTVKTRLRKAKKLLKARLEALGYER